MFCIIMIWILGVSCSSGSKQEDELRGRWVIDELYTSGLRSSASRGWIYFEPDGKYSAQLNPDAPPIKGNWTLGDGIIGLWQEEVKDLNGNRFMEPYKSTWNFEFAGDFLVLEGRADHGVQNLKLILKKDEELSESQP